jgi:hypothetical protein
MTAVRNAIGESSNKLSELVLSPKVNQFGFNVPESIQLNTFWGKTVAERTDTAFNYPLGLFRAYDHDWIAWSKPIPVTSDVDVSQDLTTLIGLRKAAPFLETKPYVAVAHNFTVEFSRTDNFNKGGGVEIFTGNVTDSFEVVFSKQYPPDGGVALNVGDTYYLNIIHNSSPDRRWFIEGSSLSQANSAGDNYIYQQEVPAGGEVSYSLNIISEFYVASENYSDTLKYQAVASLTCRLVKTIDGVAQTGATANLTLEMHTETTTGLIGNAVDISKSISTDQDTTFSLQASYPKNSDTEIGDTLYIELYSTYFSVGDNNIYSTRTGVVIQDGPAPI